MTDIPKSLDQLSAAKRKLFELLLYEERASDESTVRAAPLAAVDRGGSLPLSYSQQRMWFLDRLDPDNPAYNIPVGVLLRGRLSVAALEASLNEIIRRHEVLRTRFVAENGKPRQLIRATLRLRIPRVDLRALPAAAREAELDHLAVEHNRMRYDLETGPLPGARARRYALRGLLGRHHRGGPPSLRVANAVSVMSKSTRSESNIGR